MTVYTTKRRNPPVLSALPFDWKDPDLRAGRVVRTQTPPTILGAIIAVSLALVGLWVLIAGIFIISG